MDDDDGGILNIELSDTEDVDERQARRTGQTEAEFQAIKKDYQVKIQNGDLHETVPLPMNSATNKPHVQEIIHAAEELYFFRRYKSAIEFVDRIYASGNGATLDEDTRSLLDLCRSKSQQRLNTSAAS